VGDQQAREAVAVQRREREHDAERARDAEDDRPVHALFGREIRAAFAFEPGKPEEDRAGKPRDGQQLQEPDQQVTPEYVTPYNSSRLNLRSALRLPERRPGATIAAIGLLFVLAYGAALVALAKPGGRIVMGDALGHYVQLRSIVFDHDLQFRNEYAR